MADSTTTNLLLTKPEVGSSSDTWGNKLNTDLDKVDNLFTTVSAIAVLRLTAGGTQASTAAGARTNIGLGSIATQDASNVALTGGTLIGMTYVGATGYVESTVYGHKFPDGTVQTTAASPSGAFIWTTQSTNFTAAPLNGYYVTANITATMQAAAGAGATVSFISGTATFTIAAGAGQTIMGDTTLVVDQLYASFSLVLIGTDWRILA